jgi:hypothetical protein
MAAMQYTLLFRIECLHGYFGGGPCRGLTLAPTEDCRQMLARYQMLFRPDNGGGAVYYPSRSPLDLLNQFDETEAFTFALTSTDPALANYTEVNPRKAHPVETIFYFDNRLDHNGGSSDQTCRLNTLGAPLERAAVPVRGKLLSVVNTQAGQVSVAEPLDGRIVAQGPLVAKRPVQLDLRKQPEGLYLRRINGKPPRRFYLSDQPPVRRWGVIAIYPGGSRQAAHLPKSCTVIGGEGEVHPRTFVLALESRKTIWRYYIIPSADKQDFSHYEVVSIIKRTPGTNSVAENEIPFTLLPETRMVHGRAAWVFESQSPMPLMFSPANVFSLSLRPNQNGRPAQRTVRLPYAQPASLAVRQDVNPQQMCSEIFVYV